MEYHVSIDTAQNVKLDYELAGVGVRILSYLIDGGIRVAYAILIMLLIFNLHDAFYFDNETFAVIGILAALPFMLYPFVLETLFDGQTPGKKIMHIKVVRVDGNSPTIAGYFIRWIFGIVDFQCFYGLVAVISIAASRKGQRIGDMVAGTTVIRINKTASFKDIPLLHVEEEYVPQYPEAVKLNDNDMSIIKQILKKTERSENPEMVKLTIDKIKEVTGITEINQRDRAFLYTILKDYNYIVTRD